MMKISPVSILFETAANIQTQIGETTKDYIVRKEVTCLGYTTYVQEKVESIGKGIAGLVVYHTDCDEIKQAWQIRYKN